MRFGHPEAISSAADNGCCLTWGFDQEVVEPAELCTSREVRVLNSRQVDGASSLTTSKKYS